MTSTNTIKNLINPNNLGYSKGHTNLCDDGKTYEFFKLGGEIDPLLKAAEDPTISVEEYCEMIEEANKPKEPEVEQKTVKAKRTRKSKDIAYTYSGNGETVVTLTAKQVDFVKHLSDTCFWENGLESCIWVDCLCDEIGGQFAGKPMTVGAMISTLCEKGLGFRGKQKVNGRKCTSFELTDLGMKVFAGAEWGLE